MQNLVTSQNNPLAHNKQSTFNKDILTLDHLLSAPHKTQPTFQSIDQIFLRLNIQFFLNIRKFLNKQQYHQIVSKCKITQFQENKVLVKKGVEDQVYYVLLEGTVSYNQQKILPNIMTGQQQIQYTRILYPQRGHLLNPQTTNTPKHNFYTCLTHTLTSFISFPIAQTHNKYLKKFLLKQLDQKSFALSNTSLFKGIGYTNIKKLLPYFINKNFYKYNQTIYKQEDLSEYIYWILDGEVELIKEDLFNEIQVEKTTNRFDKDNNDVSHLNINHAGNNSLNNKQHVCKIVKLSKFQIFGIDQYVFKPGCKYLFTARVCSQSLKTICIPYRSLIYIQNSYPCINENIDFYLKRASAMHSKIVQKNFKIMENKENIKFIQKKKKGKKNKNKKKKKYPATMEWWGLAQNTVGNKKYKLQLPKFIQLQQKQLLNTLQPSQSPKCQPMFQSIGSRVSKIQQFKRKIFQQRIDQMIQNSQRQQNSLQKKQSPYKVDYVPKLNKLKIKMIDVRPKAIDMTQKVKKKLLSYAKNGSSLCDKLNLD